jgi:hypothetical protein
VLEERVKQHRMGSILRCERKKALRTWTPLAILATLILCWILGEAKKSLDEIAAGNFPEATRNPSCASRGSCVP